MDLHGISQDAFDLIVSEEVSSRKVYERKYQHPEWPGGQSGVTVGIGFDCGYSSKNEIQDAWGDKLPKEMVERLQFASGAKGERARVLTQHLKSQVTVPWDAAIDVFSNRDVPKYLSICEHTLPNFAKLSPDCKGAILSLVYNRGASFANDGDRYREMRAIKAHMESENFAAIPREFRSMKRLWPNVSGLVNRREHEALLFERGLEAEVT